MRSRLPILTVLIVVGLLAGRGTFDRPASPRGLVVTAIDVGQSTFRFRCLSCGI